MRRVAPLFVALLFITACGASDASPSPTTPSVSPPNTNPVQAAVAALKAEHSAWQFTLATYEPGSPNFSRTIEGTQTAKSSTAVSFTVAQQGRPDMRYVRIGNDTWSDTGGGTYTKSKADDNYVNLAFQQFYFDTIVTAAENQGYKFEAVGPETVSGIPATHSRLADLYVQSLVVNMSSMAPADWAADVWISDEDGSLVRLAWGPQSVAKVQDQMGFDYTVTSVDCDCPVDPPRAGVS